MELWVIERFLERLPEVGPQLHSLGISCSIYVDTLTV